MSELKKEDFERRLRKQNCMCCDYDCDFSEFYCSSDNSEFVNKKLKEGVISNAKGSSDTFSFKIPITKSIEPMIISFYSLDDDYYDDRFNSDLFVKNIYLDKYFKYSVFLWTNFKEIDMKNNENNEIKTNEINNQNQMQNNPLKSIEESKTNENFYEQSISNKKYFINSKI